MFVCAYVCMRFLEVCCVFTNRDMFGFNKAASTTAPSRIASFPLRDMRITVGLPVVKVSPGAARLQYKSNSGGGWRLQLKQGVGHFFGTGIWY